LTTWFSDNRRYLLRFLGTLLAIGLIFVLVTREGEWIDVLTALKQISWLRILLSLLLVLMSRLFVATRWYVLLRSGKVKISFSDATALTFTGIFASNFLPTTIGGDVIRLAGAIQMGYDRAVCLASIAADRVIGMLAMIFTLPFGLIPAWYGLGHGGIQSLTFASLFARLRDFFKRTFQAFSIWLKQPLALLAALACAWGHMLCTFLTLYVLIEGLGWHVGFWLIAGLWSLAYFVTLVPISINGYGVQELSLTFLFSTIGGLSTTAGLTIALLIRVLYLAASLPGAVYMPLILGAIDEDRNDES
jgi:uncharacterized membrane protein YbhN (UPF0104 family)